MFIDKKIFIPQCRFPRLCWLLAMIIMFSSSIIALHSSKVNLATLFTYLGLAMLSTGILNIFVYIKFRTKLHGAQWILVDGISSSLLSLFPLFNEITHFAILPFFLGIWELFSGIFRVIDSDELKKEKICGFGLNISIGCLELLSGVAALLRPIEEFIGMNLLVAIIFFIQGLGFLSKILLCPNLMKNNKT